MQAVFIRRAAQAAALCLTFQVAVCQTPAASPAQREAQWNEDLDFFVRGMSKKGIAIRGGIASRGQKDFEKLYPPSYFNAEITSIRADISKLSADEITLRLMRLVASPNVAHNSVGMPLSGAFFERLPLTFTWYPDALAVTGAAPEYSAALGARVVSIGGLSNLDLMTALAPYIAHENDAWLRQLAAQFIRPRAVLKHLGLIGSDGRVSIALEKPGSAPFTISVAPTDPRDKQLSAGDLLKIPTPLSRSRPGKFYWYQYLEDSQTMFLQYNTCQNDSKLPFSEFARQALAEADAHRLKRVVIDLRQNGGGNSRVIGPLKSGLSSRRKTIGAIDVLIGTGTFSSAILNARDLQRSLHATLIGEPAGGSLNGYGEVRTIVLPNSQLVVRYTTKYFTLANKGDPPALEPDVLAPHTFADAMAGRDAALEAAIAR